MYSFSTTDLYFTTLTSLTLLNMDSTPSLPRQSNGLEPGRKASKKPRESNSPRPQDPPPTHIMSVHNLVSIIISGVDPKFKATLLVTSELKQYHPSFNSTRVKLLKLETF